MKNILLVSDTPVAGTISRFAQALNFSEQYKADLFVMNNYKNSPFDLSTGAMVHFENWAEIFEKKAQKADAIIFHNTTNQILIDIARNKKRATVPYAYHLHAPPFEPPLYGYDIISNNSFDKLFCVAQGHQRFCKQADPVSNIIPDIHLHSEGFRKAAVFIGHLRATEARWSKKVPENFNKLLSNQLIGTGIDVYDIPKLFDCETVPHQTFIQTLQSFDYLIDDVCSGNFHQISLEGLKSGCIVFSAADQFATSSFSEAVECPMLPFDFVNDPAEISQLIIYYSKNVNQLRKRQNENLLFARKYLNAQRLSEIFLKKVSYLFSGAD